ncbi:MAG: rod shape-determining protein MreD [Nevskiales bacterium]
MSRYDRRTDAIAAVTVLLALLLTLLKLPDTLAVTRPALVLLVLAYWTQAAPSRFGMFIAWGMGLVLDVATAGVLGQHALAMVVSIYVLMRMRGVLRMAPMWQQCLLLLLVVVLYEFVLFWMDGVAGRSADPWYRWVPVLTTPLFWPLFHLLVLNLQGRQR